MQTTVRLICGIVAVILFVTIIATHHRHGKAGLSASLAQCASPWLRLAAVLIDGVLVLLCFLVAGATATSIGTLSADGTTLGLLWLIFIWLYHAWMESSEKRATLGKLILRLEVTDMRGQRISFLRATLRLVIKYFAWFPMGFGYLSFFLSKRKQGLHDMAAGTLVSRSGKLLF